VSGSTSQTSITSFIGSIHLVFLVSTVFLLIAIVPSALRGKRAVSPVLPVDDV
jgi:hypothetical protein